MVGNSLKSSCLKKMEHRKKPRGKHQRVIDAGHVNSLNCFLICRVRLLTPPGPWNFLWYPSGQSILEGSKLWREEEGECQETDSQQILLGAKLHYQVREPEFIHSLACHFPFPAGKSSCCLPQSISRLFKPGDWIKIGNQAWSGFIMRLYIYPKIGWWE